MSNEIDLDFEISDAVTITPPDSRAPSPSNIRPATYDPRPTIASDVASASSHLFLNEEYSDFRIVVGDKNWPAHRFVVCSQSEFFKLALRGEFKEAQEGVVTITDETPKNIYRLLSCLYTGDYRAYPTAFYGDGFNEKDLVEMHWGCISDEGLRYATRTNLAMYRLADKYGINSLQKLSLEKQFNSIEATHLMTESFWVLDRIYTEIENRDDPMRKIALEHIIRGPLVNNWDAQSPKDYPEFQEIIERNGDLAFELILALLEEKAKIEKASSELQDRLTRLEKRRNRAV